MVQHLDYLFRHKRHAPREYIHEVWQNEGVLVVVKLLDIQCVTLVINISILH